VHAFDLSFIVKQPFLANQGFFLRQIFQANHDIILRRREYMFFTDALVEVLVSPFWQDLEACASTVLPVIGIRRFWLGFGFWLLREGENQVEYYKA
jgi:hypothetical protein